MAMRRWLHPIVVDAALAVVFVALEFARLFATASALREYPVLDSGAFPVLTPGLLAFVAAIHIPLLWRQRRPLLVLALVGAGTLAGLLAFRLPIAAWGVCAALWEVGRAQDRRTSLASLAVVVATGLFGYQYAIGTGTTLLETLSIAVYNAAVFATAWGLGMWARSRRLRVQGLEREREERAGRAVADERARVARELHDILAHSISVMVVQAAGAREVLPAGADRAAEALAQIETTGRQSMVEVRRLLGLLRDAGAEHDPQPTAGLDRLDELVAQVREAGLPVAVDVVGEARTLDPSVDLSAYRIIQEALTNVIKHAVTATSVVVRLAYSERELAVEVTDDAAPAAVDSERRGGNGLLGMRERAQLVGGALEAGPLPGRGFRVLATLPVAAG